MLFLPRFVPETSTFGAGCLACGVRLKDCAVTITASFDMIAATMGLVTGRIPCCIPPWAPGTWASTVMDHLRAGCPIPSPRERAPLSICMRHIHRTCTSPRLHGTATSKSDKMQATVSERGHEA